MIKKDLNKDYDYRGKVEYLDRANIKNTRSGLFKFEFQGKKRWLRQQANANMKLGYIHRHWDIEVLDTS